MSAAYLGSLAHRSGSRRLLISHRVGIQVLELRTTLSFPPPVVVPRNSINSPVAGERGGNQPEASDEDGTAASGPGAAPPGMSLRGSGHKCGRSCLTPTYPSGVSFILLTVLGLPAPPTLAPPLSKRHPLFNERGAPAERWHRRKHLPALWMFIPPHPAPQS